MYRTVLDGLNVPHRVDQVRKLSLGGLQPVENVERLVDDRLEVRTGR